MERRTVRQMGLAAIPMFLLSQCAPQCQPACTPQTATYYTTVTANPDVPWYSVSSDARYLGVGEPMARLDIESKERIPTDIQGDLTGDGLHVVGSDASNQLVRLDLTTGAREVLPPVPAGWDLGLLWGADATASRIVVAATDEEDQTIFMFETATGQWREVGPSTGPDACDVADCTDAMISTDGSTVIFDVLDNVNPGQTWALTAAGPALISVAMGGGPANSDSSTVDVSPDGHHVLFLSTATDLAPGVPDDGNSRYYVRDTVAGTTTLIDVPLIDNYASISADGQRIAFTFETTVGGQPLQVAAVHDRSTNATTPLLPTGTAADAVQPGPIEITADGRRVYWNRAGDATTGIVIERADFVG